MPAQTTVDKFIFPDGCELAVSDDNGVSFSSLGTLAAGATATYNYDKIELESGNNAKLFSRAKNETIELAPSALWSWDPEVMAKFAGGLFDYTAVAGTPVAGATQSIASGSWNFNKFIKIENQNYNLGAITVNSVTLGTNGAIVEDTDFYIGRNAAGEYGIFIIDSATVTTESQTVEIDYDYTPTSGKYITAGDSSTVLSKFQARLRHYTDTALTTYDWELIVYSVDINSGLSLNFKGANEDGTNEITVSFTGNIDTARTAGAQLFKLLINDSALVSN